MYTTILVPLDGSKRAERILPYVEKLALGFGSKVVFLQVVETNFAYTSPYSYYTDAGLENAEREKIRGEAESYLGGLQGEFREKGIQVVFSVAEGLVVRTNISVAEREGADLIAMASHGRTGLARGALPRRWGGTGLAQALAGDLAPVSALAFLVVQMLFIPCVATVAVMHQELSSWRRTLFSVAFLSVISFGTGIVLYQGVMFLNG